MAGIKVEVNGVGKAIRAMVEFGEEAPDRIRGALKNVAQEGTDMAAFIAAARGDIYTGAGDHGDPSRHDGDLVEKIRARRAGRLAYAAVEYSSTRTKRYPAGFPYPRRIEYGMQGRSFMQPMADAMTPIAGARLELAIDDLIIEHDLES